MAIKPNDTYEWGENATHEQVAAYADTGWPSDIIPPKRTQFNWYQNLVGKWLGWAEEAVDELVGTVLERWFTIVYRAESGEDWRHAIPNENGLYEFRLGNTILHLDRWLVVVTNGTALAFRLRGGSPSVPTHFSLEFGVWDDGLSLWAKEYTFARSNSRTSILQESVTNYVSPRGLMDYFRADGVPYLAPQYVPHQSGVYMIGAVNSHLGVSIVVGDNQAYMPFDNSTDGAGFNWDGTDWIQQ